MEPLYRKYFSQLPAQQLAQLDRLSELYAHWNEQINVVSRKDIEQLAERHVLHSLAIYKFLPFSNGSTVLDIGTGGGFPGIPLAIVQPDVQFTLVDSIGKKIKVVQEVANALELKNVTAVHERAEKVKGSFDFVVSRAVAELQLLMQWSRGKFKTKHQNAIPNGLICLKGGDLSEEFKAVRAEIQEFPLTDFYTEPFFETKKIIYVPI